MQLILTIISDCGPASIKLRGSDVRYLGVMTIQLLLLQIRNSHDPMRLQEVECFSESIGCPIDWITPFDLLTESPRRAVLDRFDAVLVGGSGDYSVTAEEPWLYRSLDALRDLYEIRLPTFASCWGFQALSRALGGKVIHDLSRAELGTLPISLTEAGKNDSIFGSLPEEFFAQMGHEDCVDQLPPNAVLLASTEKNTNQAFGFADRPVYATQFHPELSKRRLLERLIAYPKYIKKITGESPQEFVDRCQETVETTSLLKRFLIQVFGNNSLKSLK